MKAFILIILSFLACLIGSGTGQGSDKPGKADEGTYLEECPGEHCEVHGNSLYKGVAPIEYGLLQEPKQRFGEVRSQNRRTEQPRKHASGQGVDRLECR
jgi:hypothetical protein